MTTLIVLLVLLVNLSFSLGLLALAYLMVIIPMREQIRDLTALQTQNRIKSNSPTYPPWMPAQPTNDLPDLEDIPIEAFYGEEEEDFKTTPEDVEDAIAERTQNTYNAPRTTSSQQLGSLKM